jgi:hypothetical protein
MTEQQVKVEFTGLFNLPGEGLVAELKYAGQAMLFDRQGLQSRILDLKQKGLDTSVEESALARINALGDRYGAEPGLF